MVLDTKERRQMLQQAAAMGESMQFASARMKVPTLVVLNGKTDQKEYVLTNKLTVIGKSAMATVRLIGLVQASHGRADQSARRRLLPRSGDKVPNVNGTPISGPVRLNDGDLVEVSGVRLSSSSASSIRHAMPAPSEASGSGGASSALRKRCQDYLFDEPPSGWDGVFTMTHK